MRLTVSRFATSLLLLHACTGHLPDGANPTLSIPVHIGEGSGEGKELPDGGTRPAQPAGSAILPASAAAAAPASTASLPAPPDPEPLRTAEQLEYTLIYEAGAARVASVRRVRFEQPVVTARKMGRFAIELWVGRELLDRVRFDFPMLATDEPRKAGERRPLQEPPPLTKGPVRATLLVPFTERTRRAVLVDRAAGQESELVWPPVATP